MGGSGAMRAAAKVAGIGVGLRGASSEHPVSASARRATRPVPAIVSSPDEVNLSSLTASQNSPIDATVQRPCWELDDWEFAGGDEELISKSGDQFPRLVFGGVPTFEEAKGATLELKDVLDKVYLSSPLAKPEHPETKDCVTSEDFATPVPKNAFKAFRLLNESPVAQSVVASIASDPNVWHAVLKNEALAEFLESQKSTASFSDMDPVPKESVAVAKYVVDPQSAKSIDGSSDSGEPADSGNGVMGFLQGIKTAVVDMMSSLSGYFQNLFGGPTTEKGSADSDGSPERNFLGASFMGLAVMVIMVVVLKRI